MMDFSDEQEEQPLQVMRGKALSDDEFAELHSGANVTVINTIPRDLGSQGIGSLVGVIHKPTHKSGVEKPKRDPITDPEAIVRIIDAIYLDLENADHVQMLVDQTGFPEETVLREARREELNGMIFQILTYAPVYGFGPSSPHYAVPRRLHN